MDTKMEICYTLWVRSRFRIFKVEKGRLMDVISILWQQNYSTRCLFFFLSVNSQRSLTVSSREQVPLLSLCVTSAVVTLKWFQCMD